jgi:glucoamylase
VAMQRMTWGLGYVPEQIWEDPDTPASPYGADPTTASIGFTNGQAIGSATPLIWGQAQYLRLVRDLQSGTLLDQPQITRTRYLTNGAPAVLPLTITSPTPGATTATAVTAVTGTTTPGAQVVIAAGQPGSATNATTVVTAVADGTGAFQATIPTPSGTTVVTATATVGAHASGWAQETVTGT